jgi:hypothetical protein
MCPAALLYVSSSSSSNAPLVCCHNKDVAISSHTHKKETIDP